MNSIKFDILQSIAGNVVALIEEFDQGSVTHRWFHSNEEAIHEELSKLFSFEKDWDHYTFVCVDQHGVQSFWGGSELKTRIYA